MYVYAGLSGMLHPMGDGHWRKSTNGRELELVKVFKEANKNLFITCSLREGSLKQCQTSGA
jgi:hypothetical protein